MANRTKPVTRKRKKKKFLMRRRPGMKSAILALLMFAALVYLLVQLIRINLLPFYMTALVAIILAALSLLLVILWFGRFRTPLMRTIGCILCVALIITGFAGGRFLSQTEEVFRNVTNLADKTVHTVSLVAMNDKGFEKVKDVNGKTVGTVNAVDETGTEKAIEQFSSDAKFETRDYDSVQDLVQALYDGQVDAILFPEESRGIIHDTDAYFNFNVWTHNIDQSVYYTDRTEGEMNKPDSVKNITKDPFTILISGNDSYGSMESTARSDVNMLVTINPKTHVVLLTSIPRDSYVQITCKKDATACESTYENGEPVMDKLTHSGLEGIATTESTVEDFLDVEINYTVRVNFSSVVNLVDALGGIDVFVEDGLAVDTFYVNGTQGVSEGWNHLEGERALAFARERYAYRDGDNQRIRNQSIVMNALIQKMISPEIFLRYGKLMDAVGVAFETNMPAKQIKDFVRYQIMSRPEWKIISYQVAGDPVEEMSYMLGGYASVTMPDETMVKAAVSAIDATIAGKSADDVQAICDGAAAQAAGAYSQEEYDQANGWLFAQPEEETVEEPAPEPVEEDTWTEPETDPYDTEGNWYSDPYDEQESWEVTY